MPKVPMSEERKLFNSLKRLFGKLINNIKEGLIKKEDIQDEARNFLESTEVDSYLKNLVSRMTARIRIDTARDLKQQAIKQHNGPAIAEALKHEMDGPVGRRVWEIIADNVQYIKTVPQEWATYISQYAAREALKGKRPEVVEAELRKILPEHITKNLKCIARTECSKANAAICQARAEACGIRCYIWRCVGDERTRESHYKMDGILVFYDDPPSPEALFPYKVSKNSYVKPYGRYHAGNTFNCRCYQEAVVDIQFLPDTFRYYRDGAIHDTTKAAFIKKFGNIAA